MAFREKEREKREEEKKADSAGVSAYFLFCLDNVC